MGGEPGGGAGEEEEQRLQRQHPGQERAETGPAFWPYRALL